METVCFISGAHDAQQCNIGSRNAAANASSHAAASGDSTCAASTLSVTVTCVRRWPASSSTSWGAPTANMPAWGGLMIAVNSFTSYMPKFDTLWCWRENAFEILELKSVQLTRTNRLDTRLASICWHVLCQSTVAFAVEWRALRDARHLSQLAWLTRPKTTPPMRLEQPLQTPHHTTCVLFRSTNTQCLWISWFI